MDIITRAFAIASNKWVWTVSPSHHRYITFYVPSVTTTIKDNIILSIAVVTTKRNQNYFHILFLTFDNHNRFQVTIS